jgi:hypothetical protein
VETLMEQGFAVFSINPKQLDRFRDRYSPAGAKDDRRDAFVLADSLRTDSLASTPCAWTSLRRFDSANYRGWTMTYDWSRIESTTNCGNNGIASFLNFSN